MGCSGGQKEKKGLSVQLRTRALEIFKKIDINNSGSIDREETSKYWKSNFAKLNTKALFDAVDFDKSGQITCDEWLTFWEIVRMSGHTEAEINEELNNLDEGKAWVQFRKVDEFVKRDQMRKKSQVKLIVQENQKRMSVVGEQQQRMSVVGEQK